MIVTKRGRPTLLKDEHYQKVLAWKPLSDLAHELGITPKQAWAMRTGYKYRQVKSERSSNTGKDGTCTRISI